MTVSDRTHRPVIDQDRCLSCGICIRACPAESQTDYRGDLHTVRGHIYNQTNLASSKDLPPCSHACPLGQDVSKYIKLIQQNHFQESVLTIREDNPLPSVCGFVCHHPCEQACMRTNLDESISIREMKRFALQHEKSNHQQILKELISKRAQPTHKKIAVIGAGPAGLSCAYFLIMAGYQVRVMDALSNPGGMLIGAIPDFRLPRWAIEQDINMIRSLGVEFTLSFRLGENASIRDLFNQGMNAVVLAIGTWKDSKLKIPGEQSEGCVTCLEFLGNLQSGNSPSISKRVLVVGGGNAAMDSARSALRMGAKEVVVAYRRTKQEMPAIASEIEAAESEGVKILPLSTPVRFVTKSGKITGLELIRTQLGDFDESGRRHPIPIEGSQFMEPADLVITAVGQQPDLSCLDKDLTSSANLDRALSEIAGVFTAGDMISGPSTVVAAIASGKQTALQVVSYLENQRC